MKKWLGSSIDVLHEALKIAHTYTFLTKKFLWIRDSFFALWFWDFARYARIMQSENFATDIHTHYRQSETAPYIHALYTRKISPQIYMRIAGRLESVGDWLGVGILAFVCVAFYICGYRLKKIVFVDWSMSKFDCKSVMGFHKFIVKMWLCIYNCMCICVCIWYWL